MKAATALICMLVPLTQAAATTSTQETPIPESCPVTRATPETQFKPSSVPRGLAPESMVFWYGSDSLYTALDPGGRWRGIASPAGTRNKSFWFRNNAEWLSERPYQLKLTYRQLDTTGPMYSGAEVTNAIIGKEVAMLTMLELPTRGCWEVTASYKNAHVSFVTWVD